MAVLQVRIDDKLRDEAKEVVDALGMDLTTAVRMFLKQMVMQNGLPFRPEIDPFFSPRKQEALKTSIEQSKKGEFVKKSLSELQAME